MGATTWAYFTPFHSDVGSALQALREKVFAAGTYQTPTGDFDKTQHERNLDYLKKLYDAMEPGPVRDHALRFVEQARAAGEQLQTEQRRRRKPRTIRGLLKQCGESETHSILDIERVSSRRETMAVSPLSSAQLAELFGTDRPSHDAVQQWSTTIDSGTPRLYQRWQGIYVVVYAGSAPVEIYFEGCSGD
jgi:hypothetical protein